MPLYYVNEAPADTASDRSPIESWPTITAGRPEDAALEYLREHGVTRLQDIPDDPDNTTALIDVATPLDENDKVYACTTYRMTFARDAAKERQP